jgi:predicted type IV restriction endonuclease
VSQQRSDLNPGRPDLAEKYSRQLRSGYWLGTNVSRQQVETILKTACEVAGLRYGSDFSITLGT